MSRTEDKFQPVGNMAAMREALVEARKVIKAMGGYWARETLPIIDTALSAPPRNCDLYGGDYKMLHTAWFDWTGSPSGQNKDGTVKMDFSEWLLAPANKNEAKA